jgi:hypothetical protein
MHVNRSNVLAIWLASPSELRFSMETIKRSQKPPLGQTPTAHDPMPASGRPNPKEKRPRRRRSMLVKQKSKAAVTIAPDATSTRDVWLDKA